MADIIIDAKVREAYDTEANWSLNNPVLLAGQLAYSSDKYGMYKIGDGETPWSELSYVVNINSSSKDGIVLKGEGQANKVWGTDETGAPGWRDSAAQPDLASATGVLAVQHGGTGLDTAPADQALVGTESGGFVGRPITDNTSIGALNYNGNNNSLITENTLANWDGRFQDADGASNLRYSALGEFGTAATNNVVNDLGVTTEGQVLDARQGKELLDKINSLTKSDIGLSEVDNKSSETIRGELTRKNVTDALGYTPPEQDTTYNGGRAISITDNHVINNDGVITVEEGEDDGTLQVSTGSQSKLIRIPGLKALAFKQSLTAEDVGALPLHGKADAALVADKAKQLEHTVSFDIAGVSKNFDGQNDVTITKAEIAYKMNEIEPIDQGSYYGITAQEETDEYGTFYFAQVKPSDFNEVWKVRYRVYGTVQNRENYSGISDVEIWGVRSNIITYKIFNSHDDMSYRTYNYISVYSATQTGALDFGHVLGLGLCGSKFPTDANYSRVFKIDVYEAYNCTVEMFPSMVIYTMIPGTGADNYNKLIHLNGYTNGLQETSDEDTYDRVRFSGIITNNTEEAFTAGQLIVSDIDGYKKLAPSATFIYARPILIVGEDIVAGGSSSENYVAGPINLADVQEGSVLTPYKPVYLKGTLSGTKFTPVSETPIIDASEQATSDDGYVYLLIGFSYSTGSFYLLPEHKIYMFSHGVFAEAARYAYSAQRLANHWGRSIDTLDKTLGDGNIHYFIASSSLGDGRPNIGSTHYDSRVLHLSWDNTDGWDTQIASLHSDFNGQLLVRAQKSGVWGAWNAVYDTGHKPQKADVGLNKVDNTADKDKPISTATQTALNAKANDNAVVKLAGAQTITGVKTFSVQQRLALGYYVYSSVGTSGTAGYCRMFRIKITAGYVNSPIRFSFARRGDSHQTWVDISYANSSSTDPALSGLHVRGPYRNVWMTKPAASTWDVYIQKSEAYDRIDITQFQIPVQDRDKMTISWLDDQASSVPKGLVGYTQASWWMPVYDISDDTCGWHNLQLTGGNDAVSDLRHSYHSKYLKGYSNAYHGEGTTVGRGILQLGNAIASDDAAKTGARGELWLYSDGKGMSTLRAAKTDKIFTSYFPAVTGTLISSADANTTQTINGTLVLAKTTDAVGGADNKPALIIGGAQTAAHIEIDNNEILAKASGNKLATLYLNEAGSAVEIPGSLHLTSTTDVQGTSNTDPALSIGNRAGNHLEFDADEIMAKSNGTTACALYLNWNGGAVRCGGVVQARGVNQGTEGTLRPIAWGTAAATTSNCPDGFVYMRY